MALQTTTKWWAALARGLQLVPVVLAGVLLTAALLKGYELATEELAEESLFTSRWTWTLLVLFELGLGIWLLGGLHRVATRWVLLVTFLGFFEAALYMAVTGYRTCHCLGRTSLSPWFALGFDAAALVAILLWQPGANGPTVLSQPRRAALLGVLFALAAIPALFSIINYTPTGLMPRLHRDPMLAARVKVQIQDATAEQLLDHLHRATGLTFLVDEQLASRWPRSLGQITMTNTPAWAIMELLANKQSVPARWDKVEGGYKLVSSVPWGKRTSWLMSGAMLLAAGAYLLWSRSRCSTTRSVAFMLCALALLLWNPGVGVAQAHDITGKFLGTLARPAQLETITLKHVMDAWKTAQDRVRTARFEWTEKKTFAKGSLNSLSAPLAQGAIPPADTTLHIQAILILDGDKVRYGTDGPHWSFQHNGFIRQRYASVFNGERIKSFWPPDSSAVPRGSIGIQDAHSDCDCLYILALTLAYRPFSPSLSTFDPSGCSLSGVGAMADGRPVIIIRKQHAEGRTQEWWVDPDRRCIPVRYIDSRNGRTIVDLQMTYEQEETGYWRLGSWRSTWYGAYGTVRESCDAMITHHAINIQVDATEFDIEFPVGTVLTDLNTGLRYIVQEGENRVIIRDELLRGASYHDLATSESGRAGAPGFPWPAFLGANVVMFLVLILLWWLLRGRPSRGALIQRGGFYDEGAKS